jgi:16S rRNA (guanine527-N7)-methyltransferase
LRRQQESDEVRRGAEALGVSVTAEHARLLLSHLDSVLDWNRKLNLTAITDREQAVTLHIVDSLAAVRYVSQTTGKTADIGSGAGFPGVPVAIVTERPVELIESIKKKAHFLDDCVASLGGLSGSRVLPFRAEEVAVSEACRYACVMARALTSLPALVELASPLLEPGGRLIALKGVPTLEELRSAASVAGIVGMKENSRLDYQLPGLEVSRSIICYAKVGESEIALPRRIGLAQKRPLA